MHLTALAASHRPASLNAALLSQAVTMMRDHQPDWHMDVSDFNAWELPLYNDAMREADGMPDACNALKERIVSSQGYILSVPEYNWSIPGNLKNTLDWLSCYRPMPFEGRTALLMCATPSQRGGVVGLSHLKTILEALGIMVYPSAFTLGDACNMLDANGLTSEKKRQELRTLIERFASFTAALHSR